MYELTNNESIVLLKTISEYPYALDILDKYGNSDLFGYKEDNTSRSSIAAIYQTFVGNDLYPSIDYNPRDQEI